MYGQVLEFPVGKLWDGADEVKCMFWSYLNSMKVDFRLVDDDDLYFTFEVDRESLTNREIGKITKYWDKIIHK